MICDSMRLPNVRVANEVPNNSLHRTSLSGRRRAQALGVSVTCRGMAEARVGRISEA